MLHVTKVLLGSIAHVPINWSADDASQIAGLLEEWLNTVVPATPSDDDAYLTAFEDAREKALKHLGDQLQNGTPLSDAVEETLDTFLQSLTEGLEDRGDELTLPWRQKFDAIRDVVNHEAGRPTPSADDPDEMRKDLLAMLHGHWRMSSTLPVDIVQFGAGERMCQTARQLKKEGLIKGTIAADNSATAIEITEKGRKFIEAKGYAFPS